MVHSGFEASAVRDTIRRPWKAAWVSLFGVRTTGPMAPEIPLDRQRPAEYVFSRNVATQMDTIRNNNKSTTIDHEDHQDLLRTPEPEGANRRQNVSSAA
jgi:hypothetical protein